MRLMLTLLLAAITFISYSQKAGGVKPVDLVKSVKSKSNFQTVSPFAIAPQKKDQVTELEGVSSDYMVLNLNKSRLNLIAKSAPKTMTLTIPTQTQDELELELVKVDIENHVATVTLNRPDKHNALSVDMFEAIVDAGEQLGSNKTVRAIVLRGEGPSFCAGLDFGEMQSLVADQNTAAQTLGRLFKRDNDPDNIAQRVSYVWQKIDTPVIAALHGVVYGGGLQIALGADIRVTSSDAKFSVMEVRYGLVPDMGITQMLPDLMPKDQALGLSLTGRVFGAAEAQDLGVVTMVDDTALEKAHAIANEIATKSPSATRAIKKLYRESWRTDAFTGLALEEKLQRELIGSKNQIEAVTASMQKRPANFE